MQVKFRQHSQFGCGSFTLANIFDDHRFVEDIPTGHGERLPDLQRKMNKFHRQLFIDAIFLTNKDFFSGNRLSYANRYVFKLSEESATPEQKELACVPFIVGFSRMNGSTHNVAVFHNLKDDHYYMVDSCLAEVKKLTLKELISDFNIVAVSVFRFWNHKEQGNFMVGPKEYFSHIFTPED